MPGYGFLHKAQGAAARRLTDRDGSLPCRREPGGVREGALMTAPSPIRRSAAASPFVLAAVLASFVGADSSILPRGDGLRASITDLRLGRLAAAVERYAEDTGAWPTSLTVLYTR